MTDRSPTDQPTDQTTDQSVDQRTGGGVTFNNHLLRYMFFSKGTKDNYWGGRDELQNLASVQDDFQLDTTTSSTGAHPRLTNHRYGSSPEAHQSQVRARNRGSPITDTGVNPWLANHSYGRASNVHQSLVRTRTPSPPITGTGTPLRINNYRYRCSTEAHQSQVCALN